MIAKLKRRYADLRWGASQIGFVIGVSNFILLVYNFTDLKQLPFELFAPLMGIILVVVYSFAGKIFRTKQMRVDHDLGFEQNPQMAKTLRMILEQNNTNPETLNQIEYLRKIESAR